MRPYWWDWEWSSRRKKMLVTIFLLPMLIIVRPIGKGIDWLFNEPEDAKPNHLRNLVRPIIAFFMEGL